METINRLSVLRWVRIPFITKPNTAPSATAARFLSSGSTTVPTANASPEVADTAMEIATL